MITLSRKMLEDKKAFASRYMGKGNASTLSEFDSNANVEKKNVATLAVEINKDIDIQINRMILGDKIKELFGKKTMKGYYKRLKEHTIYVNDESSIYCKPYCVAINLYPFIYDGMIPLGGDSQAPKHLDSFCGSYVNLIFSISSQFAGAVADVSLLTFMDYFARKDYGDDYLTTHEDTIANKFQHIFYTLNQPAAARGYQAVFYNTSIFDEYYFKSLFGSLVLPDGSHPDWKHVDRLQKWFMRWFNKERTKALLTFPVITAAFLTKNGKAKSEDFKQFLAQEMAEGNSFFLYSSDSADSLASCCRLMNKLNPFSYTLGGTGVDTGSKKVITLNINRMVQDGKDIAKEVQEVQKYLIAYDAILREMQSKGMLPVYDAGFASMDKQYLTIGINGVVEAAEYSGLTISNNAKYLDWLKSLFGAISTENTNASERYTHELSRKIMFNTELIPAENVGVKFAKWDAKDGYAVPRDCYNSYLYIVEDDTIDFVDKFNIYCKDVLDNLDGGSALHLNLEEIPVRETWEKLIDLSTKVGTNYWTYNVRTTICNECSYISKTDDPNCKKCGSSHVDYATRIIGYLKRISSFSMDRQKEAGRRIYHRS